MRCAAASSTPVKARKTPTGAVLILILGERATVKVSMIAKSSNDDNASSQPITLRNSNGVARVRLLGDGLPSLT